MLILFFIVAIIISILFFMHYYKKQSKLANEYWKVYQSLYDVRHKAYTDIKIQHKGIHFSQYIKIIAQEKSLNNVKNSTDVQTTWEPGDILFFDYKHYYTPKKGDYILMSKSQFYNINDGTKYRIAQCIACTDTMPEIYDGSETPGIGYDEWGYLHAILTKESNYTELKIVKK
jgi:hypothetical protein